MAQATSYLVLARKYRPATFAEVLGQESISTTLQNAIRSGRVAHAYLFTGPRGVGKTSMARILAKALNCERGPTPEPCNQCSICRSIDTGDDIDVIEIDGASNNTVDQVRTLCDNARYAPARSRHKVYIIDEVHMLSVAAFNALLKTLEEPPPHIKFIFATTEPHKLIETIRSRCQRFDFRRIPSSRIAQHLAAICEKEKIKAGDGVLEAIARSAHGGMRDAESLLDQLAALAEGKIEIADFERLVGGVSQQAVFQLVGAIAARDARKAIELVDDAFARGAADDELLQQLTETFRECLVARVAGADTLLLDRGEADRKVIGDLASKFTTDGLMYLVQMFAETQQKARRSTQSRIVLELALIRAAEVPDLRPLGEVLQQLRALSSGGRGSTEGKRKPATCPAEPPHESFSEDPRPPASPELTGDLWKDALALMAQRKASLAAFMADALFRPAVEAGKAQYVIELSPVGLGSAQANRELIEGILSELSGKACRIELRAAPTVAKPIAPRTAPDAPRGEHIQKAMGLLNARVVATSNVRATEGGG